MWITWKHELSKLPQPWSLETKIDVFYHRVWGWQLHVAELMINGGKSHDEQTEIKAIPHQGFALLQVCLSYFETIAKYEAGDSGRESKDSFIKGVLSVFPEVAHFPFAETREALNFLYSGARCGLYHASMTAPGIGLGTFDGVIIFNMVQKQIVINPHRLPGALAKHLREYTQRLRDVTQVNLRKNFERRFDSDNGIK